MRAIWFGVLFAWTCGSPVSSNPSPPLELASPTVRRSIEVLPASENVQVSRLLASANGFEMFWSRGRETPWTLMHVGLTSDGERRATPRAIATGMGQVAVGDPGTFGLVYPTHIRSIGHVMVVRDGKTLWDVTLPGPARDFGTMTIGWDPKARQWLVLGEDRRSVVAADSRLFFMRFDEHGQVAASMTYFSPPNANVRLSEWSNPLVWTGDRFAFVWSTYTQEANDERVFVGELVGSRATHTPITGVKGLFRATIAAIRGGVAIAGGVKCEGAWCSRIAVVTVRDGVASPPIYVSSPRLHAAESAIASDGSRIAVAWFESDLTTGVNRGAATHAAIIDHRGTVVPVMRSWPAPGTIGCRGSSGMAASSRCSTPKASTRCACSSCCFPSAAGS